jgi:hypothetical protein
MPRIVAGRHTKAAGVGAGSNGRPQRYRAPHPPILRTDSLSWPRSTGLGRSVAEVTRTIAELGERGITLRALREGVDTATPTGRAVAAIMATLAELELELSRERRTASRESRRRRGLPATKPPKLSQQRQHQLLRLAATGEPVHELAKAFGIGRVGQPHIVICLQLGKRPFTDRWGRRRDRP